MGRTPFANLPAAGANQTHLKNPDIAANLNGNNIYAVIAKRDDRMITGFTNNTPISDTLGNPKQT